MARAEIILSTDGGGEVTVVETSAFPVTGGAPAAVLVQAAYLKIMGALGMTRGTTDTEAQPAAADTTETEKNS